MKIITVRRISQAFFFVLFGWFCLISTVGDKFWQLRGLSGSATGEHWPLNWFLQLDPLVAIGTLLTTHTLYRGLLWALVTVVLTIILGRFFCSWLCPFGSMHHFVGFLAHRKKTATQKLRLNKYRKAQCVKYFILVFLLAMAAFPSLAATLQTGLLDPIPLVTRSFNLVIVAITDVAVNFTSVNQRLYEGAWLIFTIFLTAILLNMAIPRFYCRFICPLGALFGLFGRFAIWRIGKNQTPCSNCRLCETHCEGACAPADSIRITECVLCFNCRADCEKDQVISYQTQRSLAGEITNPDISRRGFCLSLTSGILAVPAVRLAGKLKSNWYNKVIRPPGALVEPEFLKRCIKCGQCMRACPTNVIQPDGIAGGLENLWTPVLNNRIGSSGCQLNCVACGQVCPTAAIRPITLDEKHGIGKFAGIGPIKLGTAFFDRNRCLPWTMNKPCIVCEENCPVSPKAIYTEEIFNIVRDGTFTIKKATATTIEIIETNLPPEKFATGDYYCLPDNQTHRKITANTENTIEISADEKFEKTPAKDSKINIQVRLQRPFVDIEKCIGCGICEHECPVSGKKAIRVSAEGETRSRDRKLLL